MSKTRGIVSTGEFLSQIDSSLTEYSALLVNKGYNTTRTLAHLTLGDIPEIPLGLHCLLIHEVTKLHSPHTRQLMNHKDVACANTISDQHIISDSPIVMSDDSSSRSMVLRPKQLFPGNSNQSNDNSGHTTLNLTVYDYQSPMEKHLSHLVVEISEKDIEIEKIKSEIDAMQPPEQSLADNVAITCGKCHMGNHTHRQYINLPCTTSISCGKIRFHKAELKAIDTKKASLKKLIRDKVSLEAECKKVRETIAATVKTFPQAIKTALINSNKKEYLTVHDGKFVPLTAKINRDITVLQKYYNGKIPSDIEQESSLFPAIIAEANKQLSIKSFTIEQ